MSPERLESIDRELLAFGKSDEVLGEVLARAKRLHGALDDVDDVLATLSGPRSREAPESQAPAGTVARPTTWEDARASNRAPVDDEEGSGLLQVDEAILHASDLPPVLAAPEATVLSKETQLYIDPPTHPPPSMPETRQHARLSDRASMEMAVENASENDADIREALAAEAGEPALALDPELGLVEPGSAPVIVSRPPTRPPPQPRPSAIPGPSTDDLLREMLDTPDSEPPPPPALPTPIPPPPPSVAENETADALAALGGNFGAADDDDAFGPERTVMMNADALRPPITPSDAGDDFELDIDEDVMVLDDVEEEATHAASARSRPPPPPPPPSHRPSDVPSKSRPPEPPGKGFLSRLLKGNKPS